MKPWLQSALEFGLICWTKTDPTSGLVFSNASKKYILVKEKFHGSLNNDGALLMLYRKYFNCTVVPPLKIWVDKLKTQH